MLVAVRICLTNPEEAASTRIPLSAGVGFLSVSESLHSPETDCHFLWISVWNSLKNTQADNPMETRSGAGSDLQNSSSSVRLATTSAAILLHPDHAVYRYISYSRLTLARTYISEEACDHSPDRRTVSKRRPKVSKRLDSTLVRNVGSYDYFSPL